MVKPSSYSESGEPIYKYEDKEREWTPPSYGEEGWSEKIERHAVRYIGEPEAVLHEVLSDLIHVDVYHIKPNAKRNYHTLFTTGMSYMPMHVPEGAEDYRYAELMVCLPPSWPISDEAFKQERYYWPVRWLKMLARFPHENETWLCMGHTMPHGDPPAPLSEETDMNGVLLVPPVRVDPGFLELRMDAERTVRFYCIVPLYEEEMKFKLKHGYEALLDKFHRHGIDELIDLKRKNVCKKRFWLF